MSCQKLFLLISMMLDNLFDMKVNSRLDFSSFFLICSSVGILINILFIVTGLCKSTNIMAIRRQVSPKLNYIKLKL